MGSHVVRTNKATKLGRKIDNHQRKNVGVGRSLKGKDGTLRSNITNILVDV